MFAGAAKSMPLIWLGREEDFVNHNLYGREQGYSAPLNSKCVVRSDEGDRKWDI